MSIKIGDAFGKLIVTGIQVNLNGGIKCECRCDCGNVRKFDGSALKLGNNKSCGCLNHGMSGTRFYQVWTNMKRRCNDPTNKSYSIYGGKGISYVPEWEYFENFRNDMADGYSDNLTLDRIDFDGDYGPGNCRWADKDTQANNTSTNRFLTYKGETLSMAKMAKKHGVKADLIKHRLYAGWTIEDAIEKPVEYEVITYNGLTKTVTDWAKEKGMTYYQLKKRLMRGWTVERALTQPLKRQPKRS